jgi:molybdate transport system substrate-binding protein
MHRSRRIALCLALVAAFTTPAIAAEPAAAPKRNLTVFAGASLTEAFKVIGSAFEQAHPGLTITFSFAGSSTLVEQIKSGAPADVLASADESTMQKATDAGEMAGAPRIFASNRLTIVVPKGNPKRIASLADLAKSGVTVVLAAPAVPAGKYAAQIFAKAGVTVTAASQEVDVRGVLHKVALDEADAGIVYVTDIRAAAGKVEAVAIPDRYNVIAQYPIAALKRAGDPQTAMAFVNFVLSAAGQVTLEEFGFRTP